MKPIWKGVIAVAILVVLLLFGWLYRQSGEDLTAIPDQPAEVAVAPLEGDASQSVSPTQPEPVDEPISVGGGTGLSAPPFGADGELLTVGLEQIPREYDVYVIVECPDGTPALLPESGTP